MSVSYFNVTPAACDSTALCDDLKLTFSFPLGEVITSGGDQAFLACEAMNATLAGAVNANGDPRSPTYNTSVGPVYGDAVFATSQGFSVSGNSATLLDPTIFDDDSSNYYRYNFTAMESDIQCGGVCTPEAFTTSSRPLIDLGTPYELFCQLRKNVNVFLDTSLATGGLDFKYTPGTQLGVYSGLFFRPYTVTRVAVNASQVLEIHFDGQYIPGLVRGRSILENTANFDVVKDGFDVEIESATVNEDTGSVAIRFSAEKFETLIYPDVGTVGFVSTSLFYTPDNIQYMFDTPQTFSFADIYPPTLKDGSPTLQPGVFTIAAKEQLGLSSTVTYLGTALVCEFTDDPVLGLTNSTLVCTFPVSAFTGSDSYTISYSLKDLNGAELAGSAVITPPDSLPLALDSGSLPYFDSSNVLHVTFNDPATRTAQSGQPGTEIYLEAPAGYLGTGSVAVVIDSQDPTRVEITFGQLASVLGGPVNVTIPPGFFQDANDLEFAGYNGTLTTYDTRKPEVVSANYQSGDEEDGAIFEIAFTEPIASVDGSKLVIYSPFQDDLQPDRNYTIISGIGTDTILMRASRLTPSLLTAPLGQYTYVKFTFSAGWIADNNGNLNDPEPKLLVDLPGNLVCRAELVELVQGGGYEILR